MNLYMTENESMLILIYPNQQRSEVDHFLRPVDDFKNPHDLVGTYCIDAEIVNETDDTATIRYFKSPQLIEEFEMITRDNTTEHYFTEVTNKHREFIDKSKVIQILNLYCIYDRGVATEVIGEKLTVKG